MTDRQRVPTSAAARVVVVVAVAALLLSAARVAAQPPGPGVDLPLCELFSQEEAARLLGQAVAPGEHVQGPLSQCRYEAIDDFTGVVLAVEDYSTPAAAQAAYERWLLPPGLTAVADLGDHAALRIDAALAALLVQQGQYLVGMVVLLPQRELTVDDLAGIVARVLERLDG